MEFTMPNKLNGQTLRIELEAVGVILPNEKDAITVSDNVLFLKVDEKDVEKVAGVLTNHKGDDLIFEETLENKLSKVGLSIADLKAALA
jgi:hypothetical protein